MDVAFSPDGSYLASSGNRLVKIWDVSTGKLLRTIDGAAETVISVAFSPDGTRLASAGRDSAVHLWDVGTGRKLRTLSSRRSMSHALAFSPDGIRGRYFARFGRSHRGAQGNRSTLR